MITSCWSPLPASATAGAAASTASCACPSWCWVRDVMWCGWEGGKANAHRGEVRAAVRKASDLQTAAADGLLYNAPNRQGPLATWPARRLTPRCSSSSKTGAAAAVCGLAWVGRRVPARLRRCRCCRAAVDPTPTCPLPSPLAPPQLPAPQRSNCGLRAHGADQCSAARAPAPAPAGERRRGGWAGAWDGRSQAGRRAAMLAV